MNIKGVRTNVFFSRKFSLIFSFIIAFFYASNAQVNGAYYDNEITDYTTICTVADGRLTVEESYVIQINNKNGDDLAEVVIPFEEKNKIQGLQVWITDNNGNIIRKLKKKEIVEKSQREYSTLYQDRYFLIFDMKYYQYPYQVHYTFRQNFDEFVSIKFWSPVLQDDTPTRHARLTVQVPRNFRIKIMQKNTVDPVVRNTEDQIIHEWEVTDALLSDETEYYAPSLEERMPFVYVLPMNFNYGVPGNYKDWISFGNWVCRLNKGSDDLPPKEKEKVKDLTRDIDDPVEKARVLYHYMQENTRYVNVAIDIGGLKTYPASYVSNNKYGDCKALSNYMQSLLAEAGINAYYTLIDADKNPARIEQDFVRSRFNHVILCVPFQDDTLWLENTDRNNPFGYLGAFTQNRSALVIKEDSSCLVKTPALSVNDVLEKRRANISIDIGNSAVVVINDDLHGPGFERLRSLMADFSDNDQKQVLLYNYIPFNSFELSDWKINVNSKDDPEIKLDYKGTVNNFTRIYSGKIVIPILKTPLPRLKKPEKRKQPVRINYPVNKQDSLFYTIKYDENYYVKLPKGDTVVTKYGAYAINFFENDNQVVAVKKYVLIPGDYDLDEYEDFYNFIKSIKNIERKSAIILKSSEQ